MGGRSIDGGALQVRLQVRRQVRLRKWCPLFGCDKNPIQFPGRKRVFHRAVGVRGVAVQHVGVRHVGVFGLCLIYLAKVQNFELRDLNPRGGEILVVLGHRLRHLQRGYRFQNAVGARFQIER